VSQADHSLSKEVVGSLEGCDDAAALVLIDTIQIGPAQLVEEVSPVLVDDGECFVDKEGVVGNHFLRTKNGDVPLLGPPIAGPSYFAALGVNEDEVESGDEVEASTQIQQTCDFNDIFEEQQVEGGGVVRKEQILNNTIPFRASGEIKKSHAKLNLNNLPFNMLRKLPGGLNGARKRKNKKQGKKSKGSHRCDGEDCESDPILCSEEGFVQSRTSGNGGTDFELEVVLPFHCVEEEVAPNVSKKGSNSGVEHLLNGGGFIVDDYQSAKSHGSDWSDESDDDVSYSREIHEAKKLIEINEKLGVNFQDGEGGMLTEWWLWRRGIVVRRLSGSKIGVINDCDNLEYKGVGWACEEKEG
jgi:hypothetical protein